MQIQKIDTKNVFIVISHISKIVEDKKQVTEKCEFVDRITDRHNRSSSVILDYIEEHVVKNRGSTGTYNDFIQYVTKNYPEQIDALEKEYKWKT